MSGSPAPVDAEQLTELHIDLAPDADAEDADHTRTTARPE
jgi:hypothetical protein